MSGTFTGTRSLTLLSPLISLGLILGLILTTHTMQHSGLLLRPTTASVGHECTLKASLFLTPLRWKTYSVRSVLQVTSIISLDTVVT